MVKYIQYKHHGKTVWVREDLMGKHREHCMCYKCEKFHPNEPNNCPIAQELYSFCVRHDMTTPVWECPEFEEVSYERAIEQDNKQKGEKV